MIDRVYKNFYY